ncbi:MAG: ABC transporter permease [Bacteroidaceae bacterium]|nr:ABC transporter permease [Bacteroidaceae bacterium]
MRNRQSTNNRFRTLLHRELRILFSRPLYIFCCVIAPLGTFILFATLMNDGLPTELPIAVVDADNTSTTRKIARNLDAMQQIDIISRYADILRATEAMRRGEIYAFYYFPQGTTADLLANRQPTISFYMNYSYLVAGSLTYRDMYITSLLANASVGRATMLAKGASLQQATTFLQPIVIETHAIGNPWLNYSIYLNNTLYPGVLSLLIFLLTTYSITSEIKFGTAKQWIKEADDNIVIALVSKLLPQTILFALMAIFYNIFLYKFLHFPIHDGIYSMIIASLLMVIASQSFGIFLSGLLPSPRWAMSIASLWGVVSFSISGFSFPIEGMSGSIQALTNLFPLRHYFMIYCNQALLGYPIAEVLIHYAALITFCLLSIIVLPRLKRALKSYSYIE